MTNFPKNVYTTLDAEQFYKKNATFKVKKEFLQNEVYTKFSKF